MTNEAQQVATIHPEVSNFFHTFHSVNQELKEAKATIVEQNNIIRTLEDQLDGMRDLLREVSAKSDYNNNLCIEMRTHFVAMQTIAKEAEKCFNSGPSRFNGVRDKATIQMSQLANEINEAVTDTEKEEIAEKNEKLAVPVNPINTAPAMPVAASQQDDKIPAFLSKPMNKIKAGKEWSK